MRLGLFSVGYAGLWGQAALGTCEFIERAAGLGYDGVMLAGKRPHLSPLDATPERVELATVPGMAHALAEEPGIEPAPQTPHAAAVDRLAVQWFQRWTGGPARTARSR